MHSYRFITLDLRCVQYVQSNMHTDDIGLPVRTHPRALSQQAPPPPPPPPQPRRYFADDISQSIFLNENIWIPIGISLTFAPKGPINNVLSLIQIMACRLDGGG